MANKSETEGLWGGRAHLLLNPGRAQSGRARQARLSKWIDWWFCRDLQILVKSQKNFSSGSEGAKTTFGCAKQGPPQSRYLLCFTMVWWFLQLFWCSEKKKNNGGDSNRKHTNLIKDRKTCLILRDSRAQFMWHVQRKAQGWHDVNELRLQTAELAQRQSPSLLGQRFNKSHGLMMDRLILMEIRHCSSEGKIINCQRYLPVVINQFLIRPAVFPKFKNKQTKNPLKPTTNKKGTLKHWYWEFKADFEETGVDSMSCITMKIVQEGLRAYCNPPKIQVNRVAMVTHTFFQRVFQPSEWLTTETTGKTLFYTLECSNLPKVTLCLCQVDTLTDKQNKMS